MAKLDVIDMNEALMTAQGLRGSTLGRNSYQEDDATEVGTVPRFTQRKVKENWTMSDAERTIFNKLGETSSSKNKVWREDSKKYFIHVWTGPTRY